MEEESFVIVVPEESDEFKKLKNEFKLTLEISVFATFWGLYILKFPIPEDIWNYVYNHKEDLPNDDIKMAFNILSGAPIEQDGVIRQMVFAEIM